MINNIIFFIVILLPLIAMLSIIFVLFNMGARPHLESISKYKTLKFLKENGTYGILQVVNHHKNSGSRLSRMIKSLKKSYIPFRKTKYVDGPCFKSSFLRKVKKFERSNHYKRNQVYTDCKVRVSYE